MKNLKIKTLSGLIVLGSLFICLQVQAQPKPMDFSKSKNPVSSMISGDGPPPPIPGGRIHPHEGPNFGSIAGKLFRRYDTDRDGELAGLELSNTTLDMVVRRPVVKTAETTGGLDLKIEAGNLEKKLVESFDLDESGGMSLRELLIAMDALKIPFKNMARGDE